LGDPPTWGFFFAASGFVFGSVGFPAGLASGGCGSCAEPARQIDKQRTTINGVNERDTLFVYTSFGSGGITARSANENLQS
jgi:hypothetical protein